MFIIKNFPNGQNITFKKYDIRAYLKKFIQDDFDGDYMVIDFYKMNNDGNYEPIMGEQDVEIYTNKTINNFIRNIEGYIRSFI